MNNPLIQLLLSQKEPNSQPILEAISNKDIKAQLNVIVAEFIDFFLFSANEKYIALVFELGEKSILFNSSLKKYTQGFLNDWNYISLEEQISTEHSTNPISYYKDCLLATESIESGLEARILPHLKQLKSLKLEGSRSENIPNWLGEFKNLELLDLEDHPIKTIAPNFYNAHNIKELSIPCSSELSISADIANLKKLTHLSLISYEGQIPEEIGSLSNLVLLNLSCTTSDKLPKELYNLTSLQQLILDESHVAEISEDIIKLINLTHLDLMNSAIEDLPNNLWSLKNLTHLNLRYLYISNLSSHIKNLKNLVELDLYRTEIKELPIEFKHLQALKMLHLNAACITNSLEVILNLKNLEKLSIYLPSKKSIPNFDDNISDIKQTLPNCILDIKGC